MTPDDRLNGLPVLHSDLTPAGPVTRAGRVVLVLDPGNVTFVVAWSGIGDHDWHQGFYGNDLAKALDYYRTRCKRHGIEATI